MIELLIVFVLGTIIGIGINWFINKKYVSINCDNINWNDNIINDFEDGKKIKTTKELIDSINKIQDEIYVVCTALIALSTVADEN